ncbi:MAG: hypothetical protein HOO06_15875 [Bdellovibrionaceae bacterium]|jgi:cytochrome c556|nr:hypothetical protein [Pseudobdellovibrionaceae bacterium]
MKRTSILILLTFLSFSVAQANQTKHPTLKSVMRDLARAVTTLNNAIFYEDYSAIEAAAHIIANHPKPKGQLPTVIKTLGPRMKQFKKVDAVVHNSAMSMENFAKKKDINGILKTQAAMTNSCVACHSQFRKEISKVLAKSNW